MSGDIDLYFYVLANSMVPAACCGPLKLHPAVACGDEKILQQHQGDLSFRAFGTPFLIAQKEMPLKFSRCIGWRARMIEPTARGNGVRDDTGKGLAGGEETQRRGRVSEEESRGLS